MKVLVTGAGGFLGGAVARQLVERGDTVHTLQRGRYEPLEALGCRQFTGTLEDAAHVAAAAEGCDAIVHVAAKAGVWGPYDAYFKANVVGTRNVLAACQSLGISKLVYTSTPSVIHSGGDIEGADESLPYPEHFETAYPATKAIAEREVLAANGATLSTVALRPHLIWGPGDPHLFPRVMDRARKGRLRLVGGGLTRVDTVYVDNAADAHLLALDRLAPGAACAGKAYFITQGEPVTQKELIERMLQAGGLPTGLRSVSPGVAWFAGAVLETAFRLFGAENEPPMTRFVAQQLATSHWYSIEGARRDLGYEPRVSFDEGMARLTAWVRSSQAA
jgi:nucleoside-diphosphate-sugar epimerase